MKAKKIIRRHALLILLLPCFTSFGQRLQEAQKDPTLGYIFPAGAQRGTTTTITVGGQYLEGAEQIYISGEGITAEVVGYDRPLTIGEVVRMRNRLQQLGEELGITKGGRLRGEDLRKMSKEAEAIGISAEDIKRMGEHGKMRRKEKIQEHAHLTEKVLVKITVAKNATLGRHELRVFRDGRISAPLGFYVGTYPEHIETKTPAIEQPCPFVINGQIMPSEEDRYTFNARKGTQLVIDCIARELVPHLADAVPGWFQAVMTLSDEDGNEVAYADDHRFSPDPMIAFKIPASGQYTLAIKDALFRGREDFVYRITLDDQQIHQTTVAKAQTALPEYKEVEPNNTPAQAMLIKKYCVITGRIQHAGDRDTFAVELNEGQSLLAEVTARRLNSPLDSVLMITDESGKQLAFNNDFEDRTLGRETHHADSHLIFSAPQKGTYTVHLGDIQNGGGSDYIYRLQLSAPVPDFALRLVPSNLNGAPGASVACTVYAVRKNGFDGAIDLKLGDSTHGLRLDGGRIPAGQDKIELTLTLPQTPLKGAIPVTLQGRAHVDGKSIVRSAMPAEDMMQAFIYHHLVPVNECLISNIKSKPARTPARLKGSLAQLKPGKTSTITFDTTTAIDPAQLSLKVEPRALPEGVTVEDIQVQEKRILIRVNTAKSAPPTEGNLLFDLFIKRTKPGANQKREGKREPVFLPAGTLPAVPFEIR